jgi:hypothetical protein
MANKLQELEHIAAVVRALSVLHPAVNFTLSNSASRSLLVSTRKATSIRSRFLEIFAGNILYVNALGILFCENVFSFLDHLVFNTGSQNAAASHLFELETVIESNTSEIVAGSQACSQCIVSAYLCTPGQHPMKSKMAQVSEACHI